MMQLDLHYRCPKTPFTLSNKLKRRYRKELIYVGDFVKREPGKDDVRFSVDEALIDHWVTTHQQFMEGGIDVPLPLNHTDDPEKNRGFVVGMEKDLNERGLPALFGIVEFADEEAEKLARTANVSIFVPNEFTDGKGKTYARPIRHTAITDYPVIPGLGKFQAIAASFDEGDVPMDELRALATKLGIPDSVADGDLLKEITAKVESLMDDSSSVGSSSSAGAGEGEGKGTPPGSAGAIKKVEYHPPVAAGFISMARDFRNTKIDSLVREQRITSAVGAKLKEKYCSDKTLNLALSHDGSSNDGFDDIIGALALNTPSTVLGEKSPAQELSLALAATDVTPEKNKLMADVERRRKEAAAK